LPAEKKRVPINHFLEEDIMAKSRDTRKDAKKKPAKSAKEKKKAKREKKNAPAFSTTTEPRG